MLFNSWQYAVFLPVVFALYWALPQRYRWPLLLAASYYFYMSWEAKYVVLILFTTAVSYAAARLIEKAGDQRRKKLILSLSAVLCLGVLFVFKYFDFFFDSLSSAFGAFGISLHPVILRLVLPVGISFYTFQTLGYIIDVYRGDCPAERNFGIYATFVSFFPQLVAGPIERTTNLLPQIKAEHPFDSDQAIRGAKLILWGLFKKIVVADNLAVYVDLVYDEPQRFHGFALVLAMVFFTFQIYCDFSGYSDIACGSANLLGIELMENFRSPYLSASVREFWSRWHISLSTWFRDYVYIPLGGNRVGRLRNYLNLMVTFLVSGLWHGANWTFVVWGGVHGLAQVIEKALRLDKRPTGKLLLLLKTVVVFAFVNLAWVLFRAQTLPDAWYVLAHLFEGISAPFQYIKSGFNDIGVHKGVLFVAIMFYIVPLFAHDVLALRRESGNFQVRKGVEWVGYVLLGLMIAFLSSKGVAAEFVYFQF